MTSRGNPSPRPVQKPLGNEDLKTEATTRQQTTEVISDNVAKAEVHHQDPEPRAQVLVSNGRSREAKTITESVVCDQSRKEGCGE